MSVFHTGDDLPVKALTNHPYREAAQDWQGSEQHGHSWERFAIAADRLGSFWPGDSASAVAYAFDTLHRARGEVTRSSPTQWSIVFDGDNLRVHFRTSGNPEVRTVDLARLDFDCAKPAQMLDVHAPLSGDISGRLEPFNFEENLLATQNFLEKWGGVSPLQAETLERGADSWDCMNPATPYQEERKLLWSPVVGWAARALLHRYWPVGVVLLLGVVIVVAWRVWARRSD